MILINERGAITPGVKLSSGYVKEASHTRLLVSGLSLGDITKLQQFSKHMMTGFNAVAFDLNFIDYSIID